MELNVNMKAKLVDNPSFISRNDSAALKGLLILLIIIGHLRGIPYLLQNYLYCFHVQCFFILPFLYPAKPLSNQNLLNLGLKLLWPFFLLYALQILLAVYVFHNSAFTDPQDLIPGIDNVSLGIWSFFTGGITLIDKFCGTQFLWFLPAFLSMSLIRGWYSTKNLSSLLKVLLFTVGTGCYVIYFVIRYGVPFYPVEFSLITQAVSPISVFEGLGYFALGMGVLFLIKRLNFNSALVYWGILLIITILYLLFNPYQLPFRIIKFFFPIVVFLALFSSKEWFGRFNILRKFGARSLAIYLIHIFLCMIAGMVIPKELLSNPGVLVLEFFVIAGLSYLLALLIDRISLLRILLFPKGEEIGIKFNRR